MRFATPPHAAARWAALLVIGVLAGCSRGGSRVAAAPSASERVATRLADADKAEVFSIDPHRRADGPDGFGGFAVVGRVPVNDPAAVRRIADALRDSASDPPAGIAKACAFVPHHGVRFAAAGGRATDVVLCFTCGDGVMAGDRFSISRGAQGPLDDALRRGGVAVPAID